MSIDPQARPTGALVADALQHLSNMVRGEVALARAEIMQNLREAVVGLGLIIGALLLVATALNLFGAALVAGLTALGLPAGFGALIIGLICVGVAYLLWLRGAEALTPSGILPARMAKNMQRDAETLKEFVKNDPI